MTQCEFCNKEATTVIAIPTLGVHSQCKEHYDLIMTELNKPK